MIVELMLVLCINKQDRTEGRPSLIMTAKTAGDVGLLKEVLPSFLIKEMPNRFDEDRVFIENNIAGGTKITICPDGYYVKRKKVI